MDEFERRVQAEIGRLEGSEFPAARRARRQRTETIRALAQATVANRPWTGGDGVLGPRRPAIVVSETTFYEKPHWYAHPLVREVIDNVTGLYLERDAAERERARQDRRAWLEAKEMEAAERQFERAGELLALPHVTKKTKGKDGESIIFNPANAAVYSAAVTLNLRASDLARRSLGLPVEVRRSELTGADGRPIETRESLEDVSDDELQRRIGTLARGVLAALGGGALPSAVPRPSADDPEGEA